MTFNILTCVIASGVLTLSIIMFFRGRKEAKSRLFLEQVSKGFEEVIDLWKKEGQTLIK